MEKRQSHILIFHYNGANRAFRPPKQVLKSAIRALCVKNSFANFCYNEGMLFFVIAINTVLIMTCLFLSSFSCCRNLTDNKTAMDGGYYSRSDILPWQNSPSSNIQGGILLDDGC